MKLFLKTQRRQNALAGGQWCKRHAENALPMRSTLPALALCARQNHEKIPPRSIAPEPPVRIMLIYVFMLPRFSSPVIRAFHFGVVGAEWMIRIRKHLISYKSAVPPHAIKATSRKIKSLVGRSGAPILSGETRGEDRASQLTEKGFSAAERLRAQWCLNLKCNPHEFEPKICVLLNMPACARARNKEIWFTSPNSKAYANL